MFGIACTDKDWFDCLRATPRIGIVNFWTPTPWNIKKLSPGQHFYFMLKAPIRKIGGYGEFQSYENMTIEAAWNRFGPANGVASRDELLSKITRFKKGHNGDIGCILLSKSIFFDDSGFIDPSQANIEFPRNVVTWKSFPGDKVALFPNPPQGPPFRLVGVEPADYAFGKRKARPGQGRFRRRLLEAYEGACCVTNETTSEVLEAAHIEPYVNEESDHVQNGILLRADLHDLFDAGLLTIDTGFRVVLSKHLSSPYYVKLQGQVVRLPSDPNCRPSPVAFDLHNRQIYRK